MIPAKVFFTRGIGNGDKKILSFENALRNAQISCYNLVKVSSIFPPYCEKVSIEEGLRHLTPGQIVYIVLSEKTESYDVNSPLTSIFASIGVARPKNPDLFGYLSEYNGENEQVEIIKNESKKLALELLQSSGSRNNSINTDIFEITAHIQLKSDSKFTTCIAAAVFIE